MKQNKVAKQSPLDFFRWGAFLFMLFVFFFQPAITSCFFDQDQTTKLAELIEQQCGEEEEDSHEEPVSEKIPTRSIHLGIGSGHFLNENGFRTILSFYPKILTDTPYLPPEQS